MSAAAQPAARERFVTNGSARLYVRDVGEGRPVVVLHGGPDFDHEYLLPELDRLAGACRLVYYDQRGRGRSFTGESADDITLESEVADLDRVRRSLEVDSVAVLGHSWGGLVAMEYAVRLPHRVSQLILMNTAPASPEDAATLRRSLAASRSHEQAAAMAAIASDPRFQDGDLDADRAYYRIHFASALRRPEQLDDLVARLRRGFTPEGIVAARAIEHRLYAQTWSADDYDLLSRLRQLRVPTLVIHGDSDLVPVELARHIAGAVPGAQLDVLHECGHFAYLEQPERTSRAITRFLGLRTGEWPPPSDAAPPVEARKTR